MSGYPYKIDMKGITKNYGGVKALQSVNFNVKSGEIHSLVGENGAGKSTLIGILAGAVQKDEGEILIDGVKVDISSPKEGIANGISVIYQELALVGALTVAENIFIDEFREGSQIIIEESVAILFPPMLESPSMIIGLTTKKPVKR